MKKLLLSLALVATGMGMANADTTVEFLSSNKQLTYTGTVSGKNIQPLKTLTNAGVTITFTKDNGDDKGGSQPAWYGLPRDRSTTRSAATPTTLWFSRFPQART